MNCIFIQKQNYSDDAFDLPKVIKKHICLVVCLFNILEAGPFSKEYFEKKFKAQ